MIELNKKWAIGANSDNIILYHKHPPKTQDVEPKWAAVGFYATLHNTLTALVNQEVRDTGLVSLKTLTAKLDEIYALIKSLPQVTTDNLRDKPTAENEKNQGG